MTHVLRNVVALGCFFGLAAVNGCSATALPEGSDSQEANSTPAGEAVDNAGGTRPPGGGGGNPAFNFCQIHTLPASGAAGTCGNTVCNLVGDTFCCDTKNGGFWDQTCVEESLRFCRSSLFGGPVSCNCPHDVCTVGGALDFGCMGFATFFPECTAVVCETDPFCCNLAPGQKGTWDKQCVNEANSMCNASCFGLP